MALTLGDNFSYLGAKPLDGRVKYDTIADMVAMSASTLYDGIIAFCVADGKNYQWKSTNDVDATLGKWREFETGGGQTYNDFTGATASAAGAHGLVPAPSAGDEGKVLFGNGAWGALPSVDLSMLSNEAFILSTTEKAVGQDKDGYLIYAKTIDCGALPNSGIKNVPHGISNMREFKFGYGSSCRTSDGLFLPMPYPAPEEYYASFYVDATNISVMTDGNRTAFTSTFITIFYTKTTDSPLAADEKFAGVTASGEVIYEKAANVNVTLTNGNWDTLLDLSSSNVDKIIYISAYGAQNNIVRGNIAELLQAQVGFYQNAVVAYKQSAYTVTVDYVVVRYTKSSS